MVTKVILDIFYGDKKLDEFMHTCDMFESGKKL